MTSADRFAVVDAMTSAAIALGWLPIGAESGEGFVAVTVRPGTGLTMPEPRDALGRVAAWHIEDSRTPGKRAGIASYPSRELAESTISAWQARDARGGRPDIHELMPYLVAVEGP
jgi:hypothetical protein